MIIESEHLNNLSKQQQDRLLRLYTNFQDLSFCDCSLIFNFLFISKHRKFIIFQMVKLKFEIVNMSSGVAHCKTEE